MARSPARTADRLPVVAFANRLPVRRLRNDWRLADGGLVTALRPAMSMSKGAWVGWDWWIHDYHLMLLPEMVRRRGARGRIGFFLHVPFPPLEIFVRLPWRTRTSSRRKPHSRR